MEKFPQNNIDDPRHSPLVEKAYKLRNEILDAGRFDLYDSIRDFDKELKKAAMAEFGEVRFFQGVPAWQALVGGTIEPVTDNVAGLEFVNGQIEKFLNKLEAKLAAR